MDSRLHSSDYYSSGPEGPPNCPEGAVCEEPCDGWCEGGFEIFMVVMAFFIGIPILVCCCLYYYSKKRNRELQQMIERQERV